MTDDEKALSVLQHIRTVGGRLSLKGLLQISAYQLERFRCSALKTSACTDFKISTKGLWNLCKES